MSDEMATKRVTAPAKRKMHITFGINGTNFVPTASPNKRITLRKSNLSVTEEF
jgi:hypothetical protein